MIYLEPRSVFDSAIVQEEPVVYGLDKLIKVLMNQHDCDYFEALDFYCFNIEPLQQRAGLIIREDDDANT